MWVSVLTMIRTRHFLATRVYPDRDAAVIEAPGALIAGRAAQILGDDAGIHDAATDPWLQRG